MKSVIVIPLYKENPKKEELASLIQCAKILNKYDICFVTYREFDFSNYKVLDKYKKDYKFEFFDKTCFNSVQTYSKLCLNPELYKRFSSYDYMFLYQLDGWVFKDELEYWCNQGYDYIGAPWFEGYEKADTNSKFIVPSGNGGVSLRNIEKFTKITEKLNENPKSRILPLKECLNNNRKGLHKYYKALKIYFSSNRNTFSGLIKQNNEDFIIAECFESIDKTFKIAPPEIALKFSFEVLPRRLYEMNNKTLPFACHAWERYDKEFFKEFIKIEALY